MDFQPILAAAAGGHGAVNPWAAIAYLVSGILFILALRGLSSPASSRRGNRYGMAGMTIAVVTTLLTHAPVTVDGGVDSIGLVEILAAIAIVIPIMPKRLPRCDEAGLDKPRSARMKKTPDTR